MEYAVFWIAVMIFLLIVVTAVVVILWLRDDRSDVVRFRDYLLNPKLRSRVSKQFAARNLAVAHLVNKPPEKLVEMLLNDNNFDLAKRAISNAGQRVVPALISAVSDLRYRRKIDVEKKDHTHVALCRAEPLTTVLECLTEYAPADAVPAIAPLVEDENKEIRKHTALLLGAIGTDAAVEPFAICCSDEDDYVRSYAMMGMQRALETDRMTEGFRAAAYSIIQPLVYRRDSTGGREAPRCLLNLDRERAISFLTSPENLVVDREGLQYALKALREYEVPVDEGHLLDLAVALENKVGKYPGDYVMSEVLLLLARIDTGAARQTITREMQSPSQQVREAATSALAASRGVEDPFGFVFDRLDTYGWDGVTAPQRLVLAVRIFINEVNNGGFSQYFFNSSGDHWQDAMSGLHAIGAASDLMLLQQAADMFGPDGPSVDDDERHRQLSRIVKKDDELFSPIEDVFFKDKEDREVQLNRYIIQHAADFGGTEDIE